MLKLSRIFINHNLLQRATYSFNVSRKKVQQVGFKTDGITDANKLSYVANQKIQYVQGRFLIYKYKKSKLQTFKRYFALSSGISGILYLLITKPYLAVFPAATPILLALEFLFIYLIAKKYKWNKNIVSEIYLLEGGNSTEIYFTNSLRRKLFAQSLSETYYNSLFINPDIKTDEIIQFNLNPFPLNTQDFDKNGLGLTWWKYFTNGENYLLISKNYQILNKQILLQVFKGKVIKSL